MNPSDCVLMDFTYRFFGSLFEYGSTLSIFCTTIKFDAYFLDAINLDGVR